MYAVEDLHVSCYFHVSFYIFEGILRRNSDSLFMAEKHVRKLLDPNVAWTQLVYKRKYIFHVHDSSGLTVFYFFVDVLFL